MGTRGRQRATSLRHPDHVRFDSRDVLAALLMLRAGWTATAVAAQLGASRKTVHNWSRRWAIDTEEAA